MDDRDSIDELQQVAEYRRAHRTVRATGKVAIALGVANVAIAVAAIQGDFINVIMLVIAGTTLISGLCNHFLPTAPGIILDGAAFVLSGSWSIFATLVIALANRGPQLDGGGVGIVLIGWGIYRFVSYGRIANAFWKKPEPETLKRLGRMVARIKSLNSSERQDIIEIRTKSLLKEQFWKGQLGTDSAILIELNGLDVLVAHKEDVQISVGGKVLIGKSLRASFCVGEHRMAGTISPESYQRYLIWKSRADKDVLELRLAKDDESGPDDRSHGQRET